jgi:hypothetical protein
MAVIGDKPKISIMLYMAFPIIIKRYISVSRPGKKIRRKKTSDNPDIFSGLMMYSGRPQTSGI